MIFILWPDGSYWMFRNSPRADPNGGISGANKMSWNGRNEQRSLNCIANALNPLRLGIGLAS